MADNATLTLSVEATEAIKDIAKFSKQTTTTAKKSEKSFKKISKSLKSIDFKSTFLVGAEAIRGFNVVASKLTGVLSDTIDAASVQEDAINSLNIALASSGQYTEAASQDFQNFASSLQGVTKFGDEAILQNAALIQSLGQLDQEGLKGATSAALDLSSALSIDLNSAATLVGKAAAGEVSSFSRYGLAIKKGATDAETFANALNAINTQFGGAAAAQVNTFSGALQQTTNTFGDLLEEIGFLITQNPVVIEGIKIINSAFQGLIKQVQANSDTIGKFVTGFFKAIINGVPTVLKALKFIPRIILGIPQAFQTVKVAFSQFIIDILDEFKFLTDAINATLGAITGEKLDFAGTLKDDLKGVREEALNTGAAIENYLSSLDAGFDSVATAAEDVANRVNKIDFTGRRKTPAVKNVEKAQVTFSDKLSEQIAKSFGTNGLQLGATLVQAIGKGAEGAKALVSKAGGAFAEALLPGLGGLVSPILDLLQQDPAELKKTIKAFTDGLTQALINIASNIDVVIEALAEAAPDVIFAIIDQLPFLIRAIIKAIPLIAVKTGEAIARVLAGLAQRILNTVTGGAFKKVSLPSAVGGGGGGGGGGTQADPEEDANDFFAGIGPALVTFFEDTKNALASLQEGLSNFATNFNQAFQGFPNAIATAFKSEVFTAEYYVNQATAIKNSISGLFVNLVSSIKNGLNQVIVGLQTAFTLLPARLVEAFRSLFGGLQDAVGNIVTGFVNALKPITDLLDRIRQLLGGGEGGLVSTVTGGAISVSDKEVKVGGVSIAQFATGGTVPAGFPNDTFPARLTSGEVVVPKDDVTKLRNFLDNQSSGGGPDMNTALLSQMVTLLSQPQTVSASAELNGEALADIILQLNRNNQRLA